MVGSSETLSDVKDTFFNGDPEYFKSQVAGWIDQFGVSSEDLKNLSISALLGRLIGEARDEKTRTSMTGLLNAAERFGFAGENAGKALKRLTGK